MFKNLLILVMMVILVIRIATLDSLQGKTLVTKVIKEILVTEEFPHLKLAAHPGNKGNAGNVGNIGKGSPKKKSFDKLGLLDQPGGGGSDRRPTFL